MFHTLKLLLPALVPSWRFFDGVAPSPRIEYALPAHPGDTAAHWHEFRPRPETLSIGVMLRRLFWNPGWNESLFLVSCAERLAENHDDLTHQEILTRIRAELARTTPYLQFRLVFVSRAGETLQRDIIYISHVHAGSA